MLGNFLPLIFVSLAAGAVSAAYAHLKNMPSETVNRLVAINTLFPLCLFLISALAMYLSDCPRLIGECYNDSYDAWQYLLLLPAAMLWFGFNLCLLTSIAYILIKRCARYIRERLQTSVLKP